MIIIGGTIQFNTEHRAETIQAIQQMMAASQAEEGCIAYTFAADLAAEDTLHLYEVWESAEALAAHRETPHMGVFREKVSPLFTKTAIKRYSADPLT